jgi:hypothetical protein
MVRGLFAVLIAVPALALALTRLLELPRLAAIGVVLMSISPGAPVALRRSLGAGGHRAFAPSLQISVAREPNRPFKFIQERLAALLHYFAGVPPNSRTTVWKSCDWRISFPAASRNRSTSSAGSTKLVGRSMK